MKIQLFSFTLGVLLALFMVGIAYRDINYSIIMLGILPLIAFKIYEI